MTCFVSSGALKFKIQPKSNCISPLHQTTLYKLVSKFNIILCHRIRRQIVSFLQLWSGNFIITWLLQSTNWYNLDQLTKLISIHISQIIQINTEWNNNYSSAAYWTAFLMLTRLNDLTIGWQNINPLSHPSATVVPQIRQARASGENLNYMTLVHKQGKQGQVVKFLTMWHYHHKQG